MNTYIDMKSRFRSRLSRVVPALFIVSLLGLCSISASAVPSYSRQTGQPCSSCHYSAPELTAYGRKFKLDGYTFSTAPATTEPKQGHNSSLNLGSLPLSMMFFTSYTSTNKSQPGHQNGNFQFPQQFALFLAGKWADHVGSFAQATYTNQTDRFSWDNTDIRLSNFKEVKLFGKSVSYGATLNNAPTVEDLWNSSPVWGFPFSRGSAPTPAAGPVINSLAGDVAGLGGYAMWNDHIYLAGTAYRSEHINDSKPSTGTCCTYNIQGAAPYWRFAYTTALKKDNIMVGSYGMHMKSTPNAVTGPKNGYTDFGADFQVDHDLTEKDVVTLRGSYMHENQSLDAFVNSGTAAMGHHYLNSTQVNGVYHYGNTVALTGAFFTTTGTADSLLYAPASVSGSANGSPNSTGYIAQAAYWPQQNIQFVAQYTGYTRFNGAKDNYDGSHRDASDNNTLYLMLMFTF